MVPGLPSRKRTQAHKPSSLSDADDIECDECGSGGSPAELLLCDGCDRGLHLFCLRPILARVPEGPWFCPHCSSRKPKQFPLIPTKIVDFFRIQRSPSEPLGKKRKKRQGSGLLMSKKKRNLLPFNPSNDPGRRLEQMALLATALMTTGAKFGNELTYVPGMAPRSVVMVGLNNLV